MTHLGPYLSFVDTAIIAVALWANLAQCKPVSYFCVVLAAIVVVLAFIKQEVPLQDWEKDNEEDQKLRDKLYGGRGRAIIHELFFAYGAISFVVTVYCLFTMKWF